MGKGPRIFASTLQTANLWLKAVEDRLLCEDRQAAYEALRAVLHALRDRLPLEAVLGLSAQSPMLIRGLLLEGWRPQDGPSSIRDPVVFVDAVAARLPPSFPYSGLEASEAVFGVLADRLDAGEVREILAHLPEPLRALWPEPGAVPVSADLSADRVPSRREVRLGTQVRWGVVVGVALTVAGGALAGALLAGAGQTIDPAHIILDPGLGLQRLAAGLLVVGVVLLLGSILGTYLLTKARRR